MLPEIILGPPGTGKTTTLLGLVEQEIAHGVSPERIGFLSFTRKAAEEAKTRAIKKFQLAPTQLQLFRTIHSLCFWALGFNSSEVFEGKKIVEFGDWLGIKVTGRFSIEEGDVFGFEVGDRCLAMIGRARVMCKPTRWLYDQDCDGLAWEIVDRVDRGLQFYKSSNKLHDYTDMLELFVKSDVSLNIETLFIDEAQDLSALQWLVVEKLMRNCKKTIIAGDDDQAIYRWAGADVEKFINMPGNTRILSRSWRVPIAVQNLSSEIIGSVRQRRLKNWSPREEPGSIARVQSFGEIDFDAGETLILSRNLCFLKDVQQELWKSGVFYEMRGATSVRRSLLEAVIAWEELRKGNYISLDRVLHVYEYMSSGVGVTRGYKRLSNFPKDGKYSMADLRDNGGLLRNDVWHEALDRIASDERAYLLKALRRGEKLLHKPKIRLSTIHGAKGGESDHVVLLRDVAWRTNEQIRNSPDDEARVWYVAVTRAREKLTIVAPQTKLNFLL